MSAQQARTRSSAAPVVFLHTASRAETALVRWIAHCLGDNGRVVTRTDQRSAARSTLTPRSDTLSAGPFGPAERQAHGKAARTKVPRRTHGEWSPAADRSDPIDLLEEQAFTRVPELV